MLVIDKRNHIGGNVYCENIAGINVHKYGAHIFHTSNKVVWEFVNSISEFNRYTNSPVASYKGMYSAGGAGKVGTTACRGIGKIEWKRTCQP